MCTEYLKPYYCFINLIDELEKIEVDIKNFESMQRIIFILDKIDYSFSEFILFQQKINESDFHDSMFERTHELFMECLLHLKNNEGKYFDETEASLKLCYLLLPFLKGALENYYSFFLNS